MSERVDPSKVISEECQDLDRRNHADRALCRAVMIAGMFIADAIRDAADKIAESNEFPR